MKRTTFIASAVVAAGLVAVTSAFVVRPAPGSPTAAPPARDATTLPATGAVAPTATSVAVPPVAGTSPASAAPLTPEAPAVADAATWAFSRASVVASGTRYETDRGTWVTGRIIEADAVASGDAAPFRSGRVRIDTAAFRPSRDVPGQRRGRWYLQGSWRITDSAAPAGALAVRHSSSALRGTYAGESAADPVLAHGRLTLTFRCPWLPAGAALSQAEGTFTGSELFEGQLLLVGHAQGRMQGGSSGGGTK
ncbi:MAG: hypothetical protein Q7W30_07190 [Coriobacteriia bacterium]|nr:hypothetical protein [Coriobacteriia bacterium]